MRRPHVYIICLLFFAGILLFTDIYIRYTDTSYCLTPIKIRRDEEIDFKVENGKETTQQIPIILVDDTQVPIQMQNIPKIGNESHFLSVSDPKNKNLSSLQDEIHSSSTITNLLAKARFKIKRETYNYSFSQSSVHGLEDLVMETGGQPLISLLVSTWRSGSTFTADLINNARPSTYFLNEPLFMYSTKQFRTLKEASEVLGILKRMLKCNYKGLENHFESKRKHFGKTILQQCTALWPYCNYKDNYDLCYDVEVTSRLCKLFPFHNVKLERLRLRLIDEILIDKALNVKVILLVRDPRGVMQSRRHEKFCNESSDCFDPSVLCADMISDYVAAGRLLQQYPNKLMVIRFEELALQPNITADRLLNFLKVKRTQAFHEFLQSHTTIEVTGPHAVSRVSRNVPFKWRTLLSFNYVNEIQMSCREAMRIWGYKMAHNETHMTSKDFNPIGDTYMFFRQ